MGRLTLLFVASGFVPLLSLLDQPPDATGLVYSAFVAIYLVLRRAAPRPTPYRWAAVRFVVAFLAAALGAEVLAWSSSYASCVEEPGLLHPQLIPDLLLAAGFYLAPALAWILVLARYRFHIAEVVLLQGVLGLFAEGQGSVAAAGLAALPWGVYIWLYLIAVYGGIAGIAFTAVRHRLPHRARAGWPKYVAFAFASLVLLLVTSEPWHATFSALGLMPTPGPICLRPLF